MMGGFRRSVVRLLLVLSIATSALLPGLAQKPPKEEQPQVLELAPEAPALVTGETARLVWLRLAPQQRGLLSRQVEESMKELRKQLRKKRLLRITAWVAGAGDVRRVSASIRELLAGWKMQIPAITVVRVGALPDRASRVVFEIEAEDEQTLNPHGLLFLAGVRSPSPEFRLDLSQEFERSLATLEERLREQGSGNGDVLAARCLVSVTQDLASLEASLQKRFPQASAHVMQAVRASPDSYTTCDAVARLSKAPDEPFFAKVITPADGGAPVTSLVTVNTPKILLSSAQLGFRATDADLALAFERLNSSLEDAASTLKMAARLDILAQSAELAQRAANQGRRFLNEKHDPALFRQTIEGLPALDATISLSVIAAIP